MVFWSYQPFYRAAGNQPFQTHTLRVGREGVGGETLNLTVIFWTFRDLKKKKMLNTARQKRVAALTLKEQTHTTVLFHDIFRETDVSHRSGEAPYSMVYCKSFAVAESQ